MSDADFKLYDFTALQPKRITGGRRNATWEYKYDPASKLWVYVVEFAVAPIIIRGTAMTEAVAWKTVEQHVRRGIT